MAKDKVESYLTENLKRFAREQRSYQAKLEKAGKSGDTGEVLATRGTLYAELGLSEDTSLLPNYAMEDTLRMLAAKGVIGAGRMRRIAVIGPGLDFTDKRDGYDFYPLQTIQPFAMMEAVLRLAALSYMNTSATVKVRISAHRPIGRPQNPSSIPRSVRSPWHAREMIGRRAPSSSWLVARRQTLLGIQAIRQLLSHVPALALQPRSDRF